MPTTQDETVLAAPAAAKLQSKPGTRDSSLGSFFRPTTVAVIGASEKPGGVGRALLENLGTFSGTLYPVNAQRDVVLGKKAYRNIASVPTKVDLAVIATPAVTVPGIIAECAAAGAASTVSSWVVGINLYAENTISGFFRVTALGILAG